jgi:glycosyltransferase involved in cell wall biosynthesis
MANRTVAYLTPLYFDEQSCLGGGERYPLNLAKGVVHASRGAYRVELISFGDAPRRLPLAPGVDLRVLTAARRPHNPLDVVSWELPEALAGADLVHIHQAFTRCTEMGLLVAKMQRKPVCVTDHGGVTSTLGAEIGHLELADRIVAQSDFTVGMFGRTHTPIVVIKGGVDGARFCPPGHPVTRDRVAFVGRLLPHKGIDVLIRALPDDLPLTICGRAYHDGYFRHLQELARGKPVEFFNDADDEGVRALYQRAWANVLPSVYRDCEGNIHRAPELMGFSLLEAMACGTPAISSRVGAMPEFIREGETGFVFDTPEQLREQLRWLAGSPELVERMGRAARRTVEREYDLRVAGAKLAALYDELIAGVREMAA